MWVELNFQSWRSLNFTDWFTVLGLNFKHAVHGNYWSDFVQIYNVYYYYIDVSTYKIFKQSDKFEV